eukprot:COSAG02_NODE_4190_length_5645_cov_5.686801_2_plen_371_part_00
MVLAGAAVQRVCFVMPSSSKDQDVLAGTLEAIALEQVQLPWQSRTARWQYRQDHVAALLPESEPESDADHEPEPKDGGVEQDQDERAGQEQEQEQASAIHTLGDAQAAAMRAAESTRRIQTAHMDRYGDNWREQRLFTVPGQPVSLLQREAPLPSFSVWRASRADTLVAEALSGNIGQTVEQMRQQEELLLSRLRALEAAAELGQWSGEDVKVNLALAQPLRTALRAVQEQIEPHVRALAKHSESEPQVAVSSPLRVSAQPKEECSVDEPPDWSEAERILDRSNSLLLAVMAGQLEVPRAAALAQDEVEPEITIEALRQQVEHVRSCTAHAKEMERSERLRRRYQQLQHASVQWHQRNEFLPADDLLDLH